MPKSGTHGHKTVRNRSKTGAGELTVSTGMTLWEYRQRSGRPYNGRPPQFQSSSAVGLNTSGALAGLKASSFPNPPMGPPKNQTCAVHRTRSAFGALTIGAGNIIITKDSIKIFSRKSFWNDEFHNGRGRQSNVYFGQKSTLCGEMA